MSKDVLDYVVEKTHELINAPSCSIEAKTAAQNWLEAIGTEEEETVTKKFMDELKADVVPIDMLIGFAESDNGIRIFGEDAAKNIAGHAKKIKSAGAVYCDCPACTAATAILEKKDVILA